MNSSTPLISRQLMTIVENQLTQLLAIEDEQQFLESFEQHKDLMQEGGPYAAPDELWWHVVAKNWMTATPLIQSWLLDVCGHDPNQVWEDGIAYCKTTDMLDWFFDNTEQAAKQEGGWVFGLLSRSEPQIFAYSLSVLSQMGDINALVLPLAKQAVEQGKNNHLQIIMPHMNEGGLTRILMWACQHNNVEAIDLSFSPERLEYVLPFFAFQDKLQGVEYLMHKMEAHRQKQAMEQALNEKGGASVTRKM